MAKQSAFSMSEAQTGQQTVAKCEKSNAKNNKLLENTRQINGKAILLPALGGKIGEERTKTNRLIIILCEWISISVSKCLKFIFLVLR